MTIVNQTASIILATLVTGIYGTAVNQLRDVSPTDWAYEVLRSLVDRYGCISGFPNQTYRGSQ